MTHVDHAFPTSALNVNGANGASVDFFATTDCLIYAEVGVYLGDTAMKIADHLAGRGEIHLFDFDDRVNCAARRLRDGGHRNVITHSNSRLLLDSYNWSLMRLLAEHEEPIFDYVFIDGAHTWGHDALAFLLVDRLLRTGGYVDLDDYSWSLRHSPSMNPDAFPDIERLYTAEQIDEPQVALVVDLLVRRDPRYTEIVPDKIFRKDAP
jgi:predicted O-methyltransferase YrrM